MLFAFLPGNKSTQAKNNKSTNTSNNASRNNSKSNISQISSNNINNNDDSYLSSEQSNNNDSDSDNSLLQLSYTNNKDSSLSNNNFSDTTKFTNSNYMTDYLQDKNYNISIERSSLEVDIEDNNNHVFDLLEKNISNYNISNCNINDVNDIDHDNDSMKEFSLNNNNNINNDFELRSDYLRSMDNICLFDFNKMFLASEKEDLCKNNNTNNDINNEKDNSENNNLSNISITKEDININNENNNNDYQGKTIYTSESIFEIKESNNNSDNAIFSIKHLRESLFNDNIFYTNISTAKMIDKLKQRSLSLDNYNKSISNTNNNKQYRNKKKITILEREKTKQKKKTLSINSNSSRFIYTKSFKEKEDLLLQKIQILVPKLIVNDNPNEYKFKEDSNSKSSHCLCCIYNTFFKDINSLSNYIFDNYSSNDKSKRNGNDYNNITHKYPSTTRRSYSLDINLIPEEASVIDINKNNNTINLEESLRNNYHKIMNKNRNRNKKRNSNILDSKTLNSILINNNIYNNSNNSNISSSTTSLSPLKRNKLNNINNVNNRDSINYTNNISNTYTII